MKKLVALFLFLISASSFAQLAPMNFPQIDPLLTEAELANDQFYSAIKNLVESTYGITCQEPELKTLTRAIIIGAVDRFIVECPKDSKSGVNISVKVRSKSNKIYIGSFNIRPYGESVK